MTASSPIVCKPTRWFISRASAIFLMFLVFTVLFYIDGSTGYRDKNEVFYLYQTFDKAGNEFSRLNQEVSLSPSSWETFVDQQTVDFPEDPYVLPADLKTPMPWPDILRDFDRMKSLQWNKLWLEYSAEMGYNETPPEQAYDRGKIREQWIVFYVCLALATATLFVILRTLSRSISADGEAVHSACGKHVPYGEMTQIDLRKWDTKGIAYINYDGSSGSGRLRIDGLTYGGFKKENNEPAELLMQHILSKFSGELISYSASPGEESSPNVESPQA